MILLIREDFVLFRLRWFVALYGMALWPTKDNDKSDDSFAWIILMFFLFKDDE
jgi:hypothetical protein